jgi:hypothetical protein
MRACTKCLKEKSDNEFYSKGKRIKECKECLNEYARKYLKEVLANPVERKKKYKRNKKYHWNRNIKRYGRIHRACFTCTCTINHIEKKK